MAPQIRQLTYVSSETKPMSLEERVQLLSKARSFNESHDITGILFYNDGLFFQLLEGPTEVIDFVMKKILNDNRHRGHMVITDHFTSEGRIFPQWKMGFYHFSALDKSVGAGLLKNDEKDEIAKLLAKPSVEPTGLLIRSLWQNNWKELIKPKV